MIRSKPSLPIANTPFKNNKYFCCTISGNATKLMVGYGPHTVIPHLSSPIFGLLSKYVDDIQVTDILINWVFLELHGQVLYILKLKNAIVLICV